MSDIGLITAYEERIAELEAERDRYRDDAYLSDYAYRRRIAELEAAVVRAATEVVEARSVVPRGNIEDRMITALAEALRDLRAFEREHSR